MKVEAKQGRRSRRTQAERRETTRHRLIEAAVDTIYAAGFNAATVANISRRAGVTSGAFQYHFPERTDLLVEVIHAIRHRINEEMEAVASTGTSLAERVARICTADWRTCSGRHYIAAMQIQLGTMDEPQLAALIADAIREIERELAAKWVAAFPDVRFTARDLQAVRDVTLAAIRGMAIRATLPTGKQQWVRERQVLQEMVTNLLEKSQHLTAPSKSPRPRGRRR